jgi:hypothetical protein
MDELRIAQPDAGERVGGREGGGREGARERRGVESIDILIELEGPAQVILPLVSL